MKDFYGISKQGLLDMESGGKLPHHKEKNSFFEHPIVVGLILIICALADIAMFYNLFSNVLYDNASYRILSVLGLVIAFDVAPVYTGIVYKRKKQGYKENLFTVILFLVTFITGIAINFWLRWMFKEDVLPLIDSNASPEMIEKKQSVFAIFGAFLPIFTSIVSFGVSYFTTDFLKKRYRQLVKSKIIIVEKLRKLHEILEDYNNNTDFYEREVESDALLYEIHRRIILERTHTYSDYVRERIKEYLLNPTALNALSERDRNALNDMLLSPNVSHALEESLQSKDEMLMLTTSEPGDLQD